MSDQEKLYDEPPGGFKKRRLQGACNLCKKRKIRCDSAKMPGNVCSNCKAFNAECIHDVSNKKKRTTFVNTTATVTTTTTTAAAALPHPSSSNSLGSSDKFSFAKSQISSILDTPSYQVPTDDFTLLLRTLKEISAYARSLEEKGVGPSTSAHSSSSLSPSDSQSHYSSPPPSAKPRSNPHVSLGPNPTNPLSLYSESYSTDTPDSDPGVIEVDLADSVKNLELGQSSDTFFGRSSNLALVKTALTIKNEYDNNGAKGKEKAPAMAFTAANFEDDGHLPVDAETAKPNKGAVEDFDTPSAYMDIEGKKRGAFWDVHPWQLPLATPAPPSLVFPPPTLLASLVHLFFSKRNRSMPLLHQPTFQRGLDAGLHERNRAFGELTLSVCALGARYSSDERVFDDRESKSGGTEHSIGWKYFNQINPMQEGTPQTALYRVQTICNVIVFLSSTSTPAQCWPLLGLAVRHAQLVGAHRQTFLGTVPSVQHELWKRAFWALVCIDSYTSAFLGRPKATDPSEYDLDLPLEVDDEYWEHPDPAQAFKQPEGKPSYVTCWTTSLKLLDILAFAQRCIYAVKKPPEMWGSSNLCGSSWDEKVVVELDAAMNKWVDSIPDFLRWDPYREDPFFFEQSVSLYCTYYWVQMQIHRPFIRPTPSSLKQPQQNQPGQSQQRYSGMAYSSLAVCANSARSCLHVLNVHWRRQDLVTNDLSNPSTSSGPSTLQTDTSKDDLNSAPMLNFQAAIFNSAIMILLNLWAGSRLGMMADPRREMEDVYHCVRILKSYEIRYQNAGRMCDIIDKFISVSDAPVIELQPWSGFQSRKRDRDTEGDEDEKQTTKMTKTASSTNSNFNRVSSSSTSNAPTFVQFTSDLDNDVPTLHVEYPSPSSLQSQTHSPEPNSSHIPLPPAQPEAGFDQSTSIPQVDRFSFNADDDSGLFRLPLHTEDLGRLPVLLSSDGGFMNASPEFGSASSATTDGLGFEFAGPRAGSDPGVASTVESWVDRFGFGSGYRNQFGYGSDSGLDSGIEQKLHEAQQRYPKQMNQFQNPIADMFNSTPAGDRWEDWGAYMANVDDVLRSMDVTL